METSHIPLLFLLFVVIRVVAIYVYKDKEETNYISKLMEIEKQAIGYVEPSNELHLGLDPYDDNALRMHVYGKRPLKKHSLKYSDLRENLTT